MSEHLQTALDVLRVERNALVEKQRKLAERLAVLDQGIESLTSLLADSDLSNPVTPLPSEQRGPISQDAPLWRHIQAAINALGPARPRAIAEHILATGYATESNDFANVVGTNLRAYPQRFRKNSEGDWENLGAKDLG